MHTTHTHTHARARAHARTHARTHTHRAVYQGNETEDQLFGKRKVFKVKDRKKGVGSR